MTTTAHSDGNDVAAAIRQIRRRLRKSQAAFAKLVLEKPHNNSHSGSIGHNGNISRYESGQVVPSPARLLAFLRFAETEEEAAPIRRCLERMDITIPDLPKKVDANAAEN
ncbi:MAG TPA: hypothetical protein VMU80_16105 [Bryobacteraceae bacterium]|nr:hypothetical protein [Bryobacteraceae bacterium]